MSTISFAEMRSFLVEQGLPSDRIFLGSAFYPFPTKAWVKAAFKANDKFLAGYGFTRKALAGLNLCNIFSLGPVFLSALSNVEAQKKAGVENENLTESIIGTIWLGAPKSHALNFAVHRDSKGQKEFVTYESQENGRVVETTRKERETCVLCLI